MLMQNSFDLNSMRIYGDSLKEGLKKTMLDQEIMFRTQVQELHRLYRIQKMLMENIDFKRSDKYTLRKPCMQPTWLFHSSNPAEHKPSVSVVEATKFSSTAMVGSTHSKSLEFPDNQVSVHYSTHGKPLDFQLLAAQLTNYIGEKKHVHGNFSDQEALNLSLSIDEEDKRVAFATSTCLDEKNSCCIQNVIDLDIDEPIEGISNKEENCVASSTFPTVTKCQTQISILSEQIITSSEKINVSSEMEDNINNYPFGNGESYPGESSSGFQKCHQTVAFKKSSITNKQCNKAGKLDLNQVQLDDSSCCSGDHKDASHSTASSRHISGIYFDSTLEITCSCDVSDAIDSVLINSNSKSALTDPKCDGIKGSEAGLTGNKVACWTQVGPCKDLGYCISDPENKDVRSKWKLSDDESTYSDSTNLATRTVKLESSRDHEISCAFESPREVKNGDANELGNDCLKEVEPPEVAMCLKTAAKLLVNFSLGSSSKTESTEVDKNMEKPKCSDSYELIALNLKECDPHDCCVSSKPYKIEGTEKKDFAFKLKRGRRLKDFQREILPGLASLSRDEIQEDINILEAVLRSREYWKIQKNWCAPVRSKRSRRNHVRRRIF